MAMKPDPDDAPLPGRHGRASMLLDDDDPLKDVSPDHQPLHHGPRRWLRVLLVLLGALVLAVGITPRVASTSLVRRLVLVRINAMLAPRVLAVDDWTLRWFHPMSISGLHLDDSARGIDLQVVRITTSGGLASMLPIGRVTLGTVTLDAPQVQVALPAKHAVPAETEASPALRSATLPAIDLAARLIILGGRVELTGTGPKPFVLENVGLDLSVASLQDSMPVKFAAFVPWANDAGRVLLEGSLPSPACLLARGKPSPEHLALTVQTLDLQGFRTLLENLTGEAWVRSGVADGRVDLGYCGLEALQVQADLAIVKFSVEPPGKLVSPAGDIRLQADVDDTEGRVTIRHLEGTSPWGSVQAEGAFDIHPDDDGHGIGNLTGHLDADLAAVTRDFGSLLGMRDDFRVERGRVRMDVVSSGTTNTVDARINLTTSDLILRLGTESFTLQPAPSLKMDLTKPDGQLPEVRELLVDLPFAHLAGKGRMDQADCKLDVDLDAFTKQAQRVLAACPMMTGTLHAEATSRPEGEHVRLIGAATANNVTMNLRSGVRVALHQGRLTASGSLPVSNGLPGSEWSNVQLAFDSEAGSLSGSADRILPPASNHPPALVGGQFKAELDLEAARGVAEPFLGFLPQGTLIKGKVVASATAEMAGNQAKVRVNAVGQALQVTTTAWDMRENDVRVRVAADADFDRGTIRVFDTHLASHIATLDLPDWQVQLPSADQTLSMRGKASGEASLAVLSTWQRAGRNGEQPPQIQGRLSFEAEGTTDAQGASVTASAKLDAFKLVSTVRNSDGTETHATFDEPHATLKLKASLPLDASRLTLDTLAAQTSLGDVDVKGVVEGLGDQRLGDLSGTLAVDFDQVSKLLRAQGVKDLTLAGRQPRPFAFKGRLAGPGSAILSYGRGNATCYLASAAFCGLNAGPADLGVSLADGVVHLDYQPALNQGKFSFTPAFEVTGKPVVLSLPPRARVLQNMQLTQQMLDQMLEYVLPLLQGCRVLGGTIDATMQEARVPLGPTLQHDTICTTALTLRNVRLEPAGVLGSLLAAAGQGGHEIAFDQYELTAECKDGRVHPSPVVVKFGKTRLTMTGTVGLDGTLAYRVVLPLSAGLVGKQAARYFDGITVDVPVTGTIRAPAVDHKALNSEVTRQVRAATEKAASDLVNGMLKTLKH